MAEAITKWIKRFQLTDQRLILLGVDRDDCIAIFVERMRMKCVCELTPVGKPCKYKTKVNRCAHNFAVDILRKIIAISKIMGSSLEIRIDDGSYISIDIHDPDPTPEKNALRNEILQLIKRAVQELPPIRQEVFKRHDLEGELIIHIAHSLRKTEKTIEEDLRLARLQIQSILLKQGFTEKYIKNLFSPPPLDCNYLIYYLIRRRIRIKFRKSAENTWGFGDLNRLSI